MKIYVAGSVSGGRHYGKYQRKIFRLLKKMGYIVLTKHVVDDSLQKKFRERAKASGNYYSYIAKHNKKLMDKADLMVAECSTGSLGTGFEVCYSAYVRKIPVIALRYDKAQGVASSTIFGDTSKLIKNYFYSASNLEDVLKKSLKSFIND